VRESLFSIIEPHLEGAKVLDLFGGSGSLGIESLSRGAGRATFVEVDPAVFGVLRDNVERLNLIRHCRLVRGDAIAFLSRPVTGGPFDVVFVDPPYSSDLAGRALELLAASGALADGGLVVVERASADDPVERVGRLELGRSRRYGGTTVDFYRVCGTPADREEES
jgi:16S rRNA (guanine966-N2)-methyltransferase